MVPIDGGSTKSVLSDRWIVYTKSRKQLLHRKYLLYDTGCIKNLNIYIFFFTGAPGFPADWLQTGQKVFFFFNGRKEQSLFFSSLTANALSNTQMTIMCSVHAPCNIFSQ